MRKGKVKEPGESKANAVKMQVRKSFAERLRGLRTGLKKSQDGLGADLGLSRGSISYYEKQSRTAPIDVLYVVADYFGVSADYLLGLEDEPEIPHLKPGSRRAAYYPPSQSMKEVADMSSQRSELWSAFSRSSLSLPAESGLRDSLLAAVMGTMDAYMVAAQFLQSGKPLEELVSALRSAGVSAELSMSILAQVSGLQGNANGSAPEGEEKA